MLGYEGEFFSVALSTTGADDGDGKLTYLKGRTPMVPGRWHHVAATFDGALTRLYVDGALEAETRAQSGRLLQDPTAPVVLGSYRDDNEDYPLDGRLRSVALEPVAWGPEDVRARFAEHADLLGHAPWTDLQFGFLVEPYLTWPTGEGMSVLFETTFPSTARVLYRRDDEPAEAAREHRSSESKRLHECRLGGLRPDSKYFYSVVAEGIDGARIESPLLSFRTASSVDKAFTFVVIEGSF